MDMRVTNMAERLNTAPLVRMLNAVQVIKENTGNPEIQAQAIQAFLLIAARHPTEIAMGEVEQRLNLTQTTTSRNLGYLSKGVTRSSDRQAGLGLIKVEEDPYYRKRKMCSLTPKGEKLAHTLSSTIGGV